MRCHRWHPSCSKGWCGSTFIIDNGLYLSSGYQRTSNSVQSLIHIKSPQYRCLSRATQDSHVLLRYPRQYHHTNLSARKMELNQLWPSYIWLCKSGTEYDQCGRGSDRNSNAIPWYEPLSAWQLEPDHSSCRNSTEDQFMPPRYYHRLLRGAPWNSLEQTQMNRQSSSTSSATDATLLPRRNSMKRKEKLQRTRTSTQCSSGCKRISTRNSFFSWTAQQWIVSLNVLLVCVSLSISFSLREAFLVDIASNKKWRVAVRLATWKGRIKGSGRVKWGFKKHRKMIVGVSVLSRRLCCVAGRSEMKFRDRSQIDVQAAQSRDGGGRGCSFVVAEAGAAWLAWRGPGPAKGTAVVRRRGWAAVRWCSNPMKAGLARARHFEFGLVSVAPTLPNPPPPPGFIQTVDPTPARSRERGVGGFMGPSHSQTGSQSH